MERGQRNRTCHVIQLGVQTPFREECQSAGNQTEHHAFDDKRPADKPVGRADHLLDGDLLTAGKHSQLYRVGDNEDRDNGQTDDHRRRDHVEHALNLNQLADNILIRAYACNPVNRFDFFDRCVRLRRIIQGKHIAVAQRIVVRVVILEDVCVVAQLLAVLLQRDIAVLEGDRRNVVDLLELRLQRFRLTRGERIVNPDYNLVGLLQSRNVIRNVVGHQRNRARQQQAYDHDHHGRHGHEAVLKNVAQAFLPIVSD